LADYRPLYMLGPRYKEGGPAKVYYKATRRADGFTVALKKPKAGRDAAERLRREIDVQINLPHPNMPAHLTRPSSRSWQANSPISPTVRSWLRRMGGVSSVRQRFRRSGGHGCIS
jgi:hypothetical protein